MNRLLSPHHGVVDKQGASTAVLRCYAELNDYLPPTERQRDNAVSLRLPITVADLIEARGIPRAEVELVLVNGRTCTADAPLHDGDRVSLYPVFEAMDVSPLLRLRRHPLRAVPARVLEVFDSFWRCDRCARIYWRGSHYERLRAFVDRLSVASAADEVESDHGDGLCSAVDRSIRPGR